MCSHLRAVWFKPVAWPLCASTTDLSDLRQVAWPFCASTSVLYDLRQVAWHLLASHSQLSDLRQVISPLCASISLLCSVHFSLSILSDSVWPQGLQQARLPCLSPTPRACSNSCTSSWWCHPTYLSSVVNLASCNQDFWHLGLFQWVSFSLQVARILELQL